MDILVVKRNFPAVVLVLLCGLLSFNSAFAAVGEIGATLDYNSKFAPSLRLPEIPGGLSMDREYSPLLELNYIQRAWLIEAPANSGYVYFTLFAGPYQLYNTIPISRDKYTRYISDKYFWEIWLDDMANFTGTKGKGEQSEGFVINPNFRLPKQVESIIGEGGPRINVSGSRRISFSGRSQWDDLPETANYKQSKFPSLHMEQTSRFKIKGQIGSKITVEVDQDSNRDVEIANTLKLRYKGEEDEIIQSIEAGNTNLSLPNSQFIGFSENVQGLFGIKATAKIGNIDLTVITSQEKGSNEKSTFNAGAQASADTIWDYQYLHNVYFYLSDQFMPGDSLIDVKLYTNDSEQNKYGLACVYPVNANGDVGGVDSIFNVSPDEETRDEVEQSYFKLMEQGADYYLYKTGKYIILNHQLSDGNVLAAYIKYIRDGQTLEIGNITSDTLVLKLIRDRTPDTSFTTWDLEWKNVYDLQARNIAAEGFVLDIYKGLGDITTDTISQDSKPFIELFGFDQYNNNDASNTIPDGLFDFNTTIPHIDPALGHLIFPQQKPFISEFLDTPNPAVYDYKYTNTSRADSKMYYMHVQTATRASTFTLGRTNIIEGSEVVKLGDGTVLKKGVDYNIVYEIGSITFINQDALSAASDITVDFEYAPFFMPEKKSLFGLAAEYRINENSAFTISGMYRKESTKEFRPRVGHEPKRWFIWDSNLLLHFKPEFITDLVDALPLVETDAVSTLEFSGEIAQNVPNPNTRNEAYIDDFEGSRQATDLVMRRGVWTESSAPVGTNSREVHNKRDLWWYNPYDPISIREIWPEKDVQSHEDRQDVLFLEYYPDSTINPDTQGWAGLMRSLYSGLADQSKTKFIEIWYLPDTTALSHPVLYIDAGNISEDIDDDGFRDTEDRNGNGVFEENEDTGLDTLYSEDEIVENPVSPDDPAGDDWDYSNSYEYSHINGTEGNRQDPDRLNRIDTEDINGNGALDLSNSYYEYTIDLNYEEYVEETTTSGWKLLRIPFQDSSVYSTVGNPDNSSINFVRMWISGVSDHYLLKLATMDFVGNKWQELSTPDPVYMHGIPVSPTFEVSVINSQENAASYESPPGVAGEYDQETGIQEKEQSLVLQYDGLYPGQRLGAYWTLLTTEDYTLYNQLKMFVHGDENLPEDLPVNFFFRLGTDSVTSFYEYRTRLYPGWDERNYVDINFTDITGLKAIWQAEAENETLSVGLTDISYGKYRVKGNPSLSTIKMFVIGIEYDSLLLDTTYVGVDSVISIDTTRVSPVPIDGQVWVDELLLTGVRKKSDFAGRFQAKVSLADLGNVTINYSRTGTDFYKLNEKKPPGKLTTSRSISGSINVDKFFPPSWGLSLPVNASWQKSLDLPRLKTGSDVVLPEDLKDDEKTENKSWQISVTERFSKNTKNWLFNWTLNRIQSRYVYSRRDGINPTQPVSNMTSFELSSSYDLSPKSKPAIKPFKWTKALFLPKTIYDIEMFYLPTTIKYDMLVKGTKSYTERKNVAPTSTYTKNFTGKQSYAIGLFNALRADFNTQTDRDISDPDLVNLSFNPADIRLGREKTYSQSLNSSFSPKITRALAPRFTYSAKYSDNSDLARNPDSTRSSSANSSIRGDLTLDVFEITGIKKLLGAGEQKNKFVKPPGKPRDEEREKEEPEEKGEGSIDGGDNVDESKDKADDDEPKKKIKIPNPLIGVKKVFSILNTVKPLKTTVSVDKRMDRAGLYTRPGWYYTLGFTDDPDVLRKDETTYTRDQITRTMDYSLQSGITPLRNLDISSSYKFRESISRSSNSTEPTGTNSVEFPRIDANISGLHSLPIFNKLTSSMTLQSNFTKKIDESGNPDTDVVNSRTDNQSFSPVAGLNIVLVNDVKLTFRYDWTKKKTEDLRPEGSNRTDYDNSRTFKVSLSYSFTAPKGVNLPLFGRFKFTSQLTMSLDVNKRFSKSWFVNSENEKTTDAESEEISIEPRMTYRFSAKVTGGINAKWSDADDKIQDRKRHVRELGIWTELRF